MKNPICFLPAIAKKFLTKKSRPFLEHAVVFRLCAVILAIGIFTVFMDQAKACSVPVFRYSLERFAPDPYDFLIYHRGPLSAEVKAAVDALQKLAGEEDKSVPIRVRLIDLAARDAEKKNLAKVDSNRKEPTNPPERQSLKKEENPDYSPPANAVLPWLAVMPIGGSEETLAWSGPLRNEDLRPMIDSPIRREVVQRLTKGDSAVFLFLPGDKREENDAAEKLLRENLKELEKSLRLPPQDGPSQLRSEIPLKIAFSVLHISRTDPAERCLVQMLLNLSKTSGPVIFPVFGRGRILACLSGESLTAENLQEVGEFLCGNCTCTIKSQMPGVDLLMVADWDSLLEGRVVREEPAGLQGLASLAQAAASEVSQKAPVAIPGSPDPPAVVPSAKSAESVEPQENLLFWAIGGTLLGGIVLVMVGSLLIKGRSRKGNE